MKNKTEKWKTQQRTNAAKNKSKLVKFNKEKALKKEKRIRHENNLKLEKAKREQNEKVS
jgi:hypothetical protein